MKRKYRISLILLFVIYIILFNNIKVLANQNLSEIKTVESKVLVNGKEKINLPDSKIINNNLYLPMRAYYEGLEEEVTWDSKNKLAISNFIFDEYKFKAGSNKVFFNNKEILIDNQILIINSKTYIPIEDILKLSDHKFNIIDNNIDIILEDKNLIKTGETYISNIFDIKSYDRLFKNKKTIDSLYGRKTHVFYDDANNLLLSITTENNEIISIWSNSNNIEIAGIKVGSDLNKIDTIKVNKYLNYYGYKIDTFAIDDLSKISFLGINKNGESIQNGLLKSDSSVEILYSENILRGYETLIYGYLNNFRKSNNLSLLKQCDILSDFSKDHNNEMIEYKYFSHNSFDNKSYASRVKNIMKDNNFSLMAENIAAGIYSPEEVTNLWLNSKIHRDNILNSFNKIGISVEYALRSKYGLYFTTNFAR